MTLGKIKKQVKKIKKSTKKKVVNFQGEAEEKIKLLSKLAGKNLVKAKNEFGDIETKVKSYIRENPEKLFIAAAGIGAFVGAITAILLEQGKKKK